MSQLQWCTVSRTPGPQCSLAIWIASGDHCVAGLVNDGRYVRAGGDSPKAVPSRNANEELVQRWCPVLTMKYVTLPNALDFVANQVIKRGTECYLCYGEEYELFQ